MKKIKLTQNKVALVDDSDFAELNKYKWHATKNGNTFYARRNSKIVKGRKTNIHMHRVIMNTPTDMDTDHIDGDGLNNQRSNLRVCSTQENLMNKKRYKNNKSGLKGVSWHKPTKKWISQICVNRKVINLGLYLSKEEAGEAYIKASIKYHGDFATNKK